MPTPSISLCMIVRDVKQTIEKCLNSVLPFVDELVIVDTGSEDETKQIVRNLAPAAKIYDFNSTTHPQAFLPDTEETWKEAGILGPYSGKMMLADFGAARQHGWEKATSDYLLWIDSDDVLEGGEHLRRIVEEMERDRVDTALFNYDYASDHLGNVQCKLTRERLARRSFGTAWKQPIHEVLVPLGNGRFYAECNVKHLRHELNLQPQIHNRNLKVLAKWWLENRTKKDIDARMIFYLAMEERFIWPERAIEHFQYYCKLSGWDEERGIAHMLAGAVHEQKGRLEEAFSDYAQAAMEAHWNPDSFFGAARIAYFKRDWAKCIEWTEKGFEVAKRTEGRQSVLMYNPMDRLYRPHIFYSAALIESGRMKDALATCIEGLKYNPEDPHLLGNKQVAESCLANQKEQTMSGSQALKIRQDLPLDSRSQGIPTDVLVAFLIEMWKENMEAGLYVKALQIIDAAPNQVGFSPRVRQAREITIAKMQALEGSESKAEPSKPSKPVEAAQEKQENVHIIVPPGKLNICIWTGPGWERWTPETPDTVGLGGSETAAISMGRELRKLGHYVRVISDCGDKAGLYDGVEYVHYEKAMANPNDFACDILVISRQPAAFAVGIPHKASFVWVHDIHVGDPSGDMGKWMLKADRYFCLSQWHKQFFLKTYPFLHSDTIIVTKNGIDIRYFEEEPRKEGNRLIYSSSPDRGLERLIELFPRIKEQVPDAELDVYYGFQTWKSMAEMTRNQGELDRIRHFEELLARAKDIGVNFHGRVNKIELSKAFLRSKVWAYPTWFTETYCITALEAQAAGCVPVTSALAALPETVSHGFIIQRYANTSPEYADVFIKRVVKLLQDEEERSKFARGGREYTFAHHGWDKVAQKWEAHFQELLKEKASVPIALPRFGD